MTTNQLLRACFICLGVVIIANNAGCSATGPATSTASATTEQQLRDLTRKYETGTLSKEEYERQSAEIHNIRQRELLQSGSPLNETVRGVLSAP
jgi:hypothetical protein